MTRSAAAGAGLARSARLAVAPAQRASACAACTRPSSDRKQPGKDEDMKIRYRKGHEAIEKKILDNLSPQEPQALLNRFSTL